MKIGNFKEVKKKSRKICFFGNFGTGNLGNESTLQAILYHLRQHLPDAEVNCICTGPETAAAIHNIATVPMHELFVKPELLQNNPLTRLFRKVLIGIPIELYRWLKAFLVLKGADMLIVPGTGLLTDAFGLLSWGPYNIFKYSLVAKLCRCKLLFVSVGAGPIYSVLGRWLIKSALFLADFRSYRDNSTNEYLKGIGFPTNNDRVYPDLAFSLPKAVIPDDPQKGHRPVVGLGLMEHAGMYGAGGPRDADYLAYLENLSVFASWLMAHGYDVRLLIGDVHDKQVMQVIKNLLERYGLWRKEGRIIEEVASSVQHLLLQLATTDVVVATRFHNIVFSLILNKPVISISFHHKCVSLMKTIGMSEYSQDLDNVDADKLIEQFCEIEKNTERLKLLIKQKAEEFRRVLDEQYNIIFNNV